MKNIYTLAASLAVLFAFAACDSVPEPATTTAEPTIVATAAAIPTTPTEVITAMPGSIPFPKPPPAVLIIDGKEQVAGIGTYCWFIDRKGLCADYIGIVTPKVPLSIQSPAIATLRLPLTQVPSEISLNAIPVTYANEMESNSVDSRIWYAQKVNGWELKAALSAEQKVELTLKLGLYVLSIFTAWQGYGDVSYGFLLEVK